MKTKTLLTALAATASLATSSAYGALVVYDGFNYAVDLTSTAGALHGNNGGIGFGGAWEDMTSGSNSGQGYIYSSAGNTTGDPATNGTTPPKPDWDGLMNGVPQTGNYVGGDALLSDTQNDRNNSRRALATNAGALAGADNILWASYIVHFEDSRFNFNPGFALTDGGGFEERVRTLSDTSNGLGIGSGGTFNAVDVTLSQYNGGIRDEGTRVNVMNLDTTIADYLIVLKYEFGATDTLSAFAFAEGSTISEAEFNINAISGSFAIDESTLDTLTVGITRAGNAYDEIRMGDSFTDVVSAVPEPGSLALLGLGGLLLASRRRRG